MNGCDQANLQAVLLSEFKHANIRELTVFNRSV